MSYEIQNMCYVFPQKCPNLNISVVGKFIFKILIILFSQETETTRIIYCVEKVLLRAWK